jgi:hypothetical protein
MKKSISSVVVFSVILCCLIYLIQFGIDTYYKKTIKNKFTRLLNHEIDADIMIFGSSIAYHQMDPEIIRNVTGMPTYNMGLDGLYFVQYNALMKEYLSYTKKNKYFVLACDFSNLGKNDLITRPDLFWAHINNKHIYESLREIEPGKAAKALYIPGYKFTLLNKSFYNSFLFPTNETGHDGYEQPKENDAWKATPDTLKPYQARYDEHIYNMLKETIGEIVKKGKKVVLVMTPVYDEGYQAILNADYIKSKYKELSGNNVFYLDYTQDTLSRRKANFVDYSHLGTKPAEIFSQMLATDLKRIIDENK